jgi:hypothetical protein
MYAILIDNTFIITTRLFLGRLQADDEQSATWTVRSQVDEKRPTRLRVGIGSRPAAVKAAGMSRHSFEKSLRPGRPKTRLGLPDLDHSKSAVLDSLRSPESKRGYLHPIDEFIQWYCSEPRLSFNKIVVKLTDKDTIVVGAFDNKTGDTVFDDTLKQGLAVQLEKRRFSPGCPTTK